MRLSVRARVRVRLLVRAQLEAVVAREDDNGLGTARLHLHEQSPHHLVDEGRRREVGAPQRARALGGHPIGVRLGRRLPWLGSGLGLGLT